MGKTLTAEEKKAAAAAKEAEKKAKADAKAAEKAAKDAEKALGAAPTKSATSVKVVDSKSGAERVYSEEKHGENFRALADEFASKVPTRKVVAA